MSIAHAEFTGLTHIFKVWCNFVFFTDSDNTLHVLDIFLFPVQTRTWLDRV